MTKYEFIAKDLYERIATKEFSKTDKLPTEEQLMKEYNVSRNTVRKAIELLAKQGAVYPVQGSGLFIKKTLKPDTIYLNSTRGLTADHSENKITNKLLHLKIIEADEILSKRMQCPLKTPIYYIVRLRYMDKKPYAVEYAYYNKTIVPYLGKEIANQSIFDYIKSDLKLSVGFADKYINAEKLNAYDSELLQLNENDPAIIIEDNVHLSNGLLFNSSRIVYHYQLANFFMASQ